MRVRSILAILALVVLAAPIACKSSGGKINATSTIEIDPSATSVEVDASQSSSYVITVRNTGQGKVLNVTDVKLNYTPATDAESAGDPAFSLVASGLPAKVSPKGEGLGAETYEFTVNFLRYDDSTTRVATLTIVNDNSTDANLQNLKIVFTTRLCEPSLQAPVKVDFATVTLEDKSGEQDILLSNTGSCRLVMDWLLLDGSPGFMVDLGDGRTFTAAASAEVVQLTPPVTIDANSGLKWTSTFTPTDGEPAQAILTLHSNETGVIDGKRQVELVGNSTGPRLKVDPAKVEFGGKKIGKAAGVVVTVTSIGTQPLIITGIAMKTPDSSTDFTLDFASTPEITAFFPNGAPTAAAPITIEVNSSVKFLAKFTPDVKNPTDAQGAVIQDTGAIVISSNTFSPKTEVPETGYGVDVDCPQPVIVIEEGEEAKPQDIIHLHGEQSQPASGSIQSYSWTVQQPSDNKFALVPAANFYAPTHEVNVGGDYTYCLDVCDSDFCSSDPQCKTTACKKVSVVPDEAIHCELTWDTPGDSNQFDSGPDAGSDMDLHFLHPFATGPDLDGDGKPDGWFDIPYDVFWYNKNPEWESVNPNVADNPSLDRDDTDGAGPENVNLRVPVAGRVYRVGVHYWDDHGFGFSYPRLKCYIWGQLVFDRDLEALGHKMVKCDMWEAATITWPQGIVTAVQNADGSLKITPNYMNNAFVVVGGSSCGQQ